MTTTKEKITQRLLVGCLYTSEWKMLTHLSNYWKEMQITSQEQRELFLVSHSGKEYIASYIESIPQTLKDIEKYTQDFRQKLAKIAPKKDSNQVPIVIFPQLFIA